MKPVINRPGRPQPASHRCAAEGCQHLVQPGFLMCNDHWRQVPTKLKTEVWRTYRLLGRQREAPEAYRRAVQVAVDAVRQKQLNKKDARDASTRPLF